MSCSDPHPKVPLKGELLRRITERYPELDMGTVVIVSQIQAISRSVSAHVNNDLAKYGLTEGKFYVLCFLFSEELLGSEVPSPSAIADHVGVTRGTVTGLLDGLERENLITRHSDSRDRRSLTIQLTEKARQVLDDFLHSSTQSLFHAIPLSETEREGLSGYLSRIADALNAGELENG